MDQSIAVLARLHGAEPTAYRLVYRSPGDEVAEASQAGCFFAAMSALVGTFIGGRLMVARGEELPPTEAAIFAAVVGFSLGFWSSESSPHASWPWCRPPAPGPGTRRGCLPSC